MKTTSTLLLKIVLAIVFSFFAFFSFAQNDYFVSELIDQKGESHQTVLSPQANPVKVAAILCSKVSKINPLVNSKLLLLKMKQFSLFSSLKFNIQPESFRKQKSLFCDYLQLVYLSSQHYPPPLFLLIFF